MNVGQSLLLGGVGAAGGIANRSWNERRSAEQAIPGLEHQVQFNNQEAARKAQTANVNAQPGDRDAERQRKERADASRVDIQNRTLNWKAEDKLAYHKLAQDKLDARRDNDDQKYELAVRAQDELERKNSAVEKQTDRKLDQIDTKEVHNLAKTAQTNQRITAHNAVLDGNAQQKTLEAIEANGAKAGKSDNEIQTAKDNFLKRQSELAAAATAPRTHRKH